MKKKYDEGGSVLVDSEDRPVRFDYESDEEYEKRARPTMTALQMEDVSSSRAAPSKTRDFLSRLFNKPFKEYEKFDRRKSSERKAKGGKVGSASKRADGIAMRGKTRGKMV